MEVGRPQDNGGSWIYFELSPAGPQTCSRGRLQITFLVFLCCCLRFLLFLVGERGGISNEASNGKETLQNRMREFVSICLDLHF